MVRWRSRTRRARSQLADGRLLSGKTGLSSFICLRKHRAARGVWAIILRPPYSKRGDSPGTQRRLRSESTSPATAGKKWGSWMRRASTGLCTPVSLSSRTLSGLIDRMDMGLALLRRNRRTYLVEVAAATGSMKTGKVKTDQRS
ncbi:hypothetical protein BDW72DRAFT_79742 [Aspergillus terricola var. indicus]